MLPASIRLTAVDSAYSPLLLQMKGYPEVLSCVGDPEVLQTPTISIIGSRKMSRYGEMVARLLVPPLVQAGLMVVSGLAYGIDSLSQRLALKEGGRCVAVLGSGFNRLYPPSHLPLAEEIARSGCLLSEYGPDEEPLKHHFPERNRIVAGLSPFTLIIEAAAYSGTLSTASHALNAGREVGVVPGDIMAEQSAGVHQLLLQGARPITCAQDVLDVYGIEGPAAKSRPEPPPELSALYRLITPEGQSIDWLQSHLDCAPSELQRMLSVLELDGYIRFNRYVWLKIS